MEAFAGFLALILGTLLYIWVRQNFTIYFTDIKGIIGIYVSCVIVAGVGALLVLKGIGFLFHGLFSILFVLIKLALFVCAIVWVYNKVKGHKSNKETAKEE